MAYEDESDKLSEEDTAELLAEAKDRWEDCENHYSEMYENAEEDWSFVHGQGQWDIGASESRKKDGRPCLVLNQCLPYVHQITNDIKQARLAIRVVPIDSEADVETAEIRAGVIRNIEKQSSSKDVYGTAASNAVGAGIGWIRVKIDYAGTDTFDQEAILERVLDFTSVFLDPQDLSVDGSGADFGFARLTYTCDKFEELYPDAEKSSFYGMDSSNMATDDEVSLVEYYYKEFEKNTIHQIQITGIDGRPKIGVFTSDELKDLDDIGAPYEKLASREVDDFKIYHCVLSGSEILSREEFPSQYIPLVPVIGEEYFTGGKREFRSLIHQAKDAQRMYNYLKSENVSIMALQPKAPYIGATGQFRSQRDKWQTANNQNFSTLEYDMVIDEETGIPAPPPMRQPPPQGSPAMMQEAISARDDIRLALGIPQSNMGERSNAVSGIAIRSQQVEGDNATFHFIDNLSSSIAQVGRICNDLMVLYTDQQTARIIGDDGEEDSVPVNTPYIKDEDGTLRPVRDGETPEGIYDLSVGKYDIDMDVGPSYASGRQEAADKLTELANRNPEMYGVAGDLIVEALDIPNGDVIADRIKSQMDPSVLGDDPQAAKLQEAAKALKQMQEQLANYEAALADKESNQKFDQAAKAEEIQLERDKFEVSAEKTKADIAKTYADIQNSNAETASQSLANVDAITEQMNDMGGAIEIILDSIEDDMEASEPLENTDVMLEEGEQL